MSSTAVISRRILERLPRHSYFWGSDESSERPRPWWRRSLPWTARRTIHSAVSDFLYLHKPSRPRAQSLETLHDLAVEHARRRSPSITCTSSGQRPRSGRPERRRDLGADTERHL